MNKFVRCLLAVCCLLEFSLSSLAAEPVRIGVLAFRPKPQTLAQWRPLAAALQRAIPEREFVVEALSYEEMEAAVASRQLDFVLTNPGHYVLMAHRIGLSAPLATLVNSEGGKPVQAFGGVIFCRAGRTDINELADLRGKTVAIVFATSMGGHLMQVYEMSKAGIRLSTDAHFLAIGLPQDRVVEAVLAGKADAGFVRTGLLESLALEGKLDLAQLKVINRQNQPDYPWMVSTRLYPEWPFVSMPYTDASLARRVAAALFTLGDDAAVASAIGIQGFNVPADYAPVEDMLRALRQPPFDTLPAFTLEDVWERYRWFFITMLVAGGAIVLLAIRLMMANRKLAIESQAVLNQSRQLQENELRFRTVADYTYDWEYWEGANHQILYMSPSCQAMTGYTREDFVGDPDLLRRIIHPDDMHVMEGHQHNVVNQDANEAIDFRIVRRDGEVRWIAHVCKAVFGQDGQYNGRRVTNRDITERKVAEQRLQALNRDFIILLESTTDFIYFKDRDSRIRFCSQTMAEITGHQSWRDMIGKHDREIFPEATARIYEEEELPVFRDGIPVLNKVDPYFDAQGNPGWVSTNKWPVFDEEGKAVVGIFGISRDITGLKLAQDELNRKTEALQRSNADLEQFAYSVSHDMRQPLRMVTGHLQLLARSLGEQLKDDDRTNLNFALDGAKRMDAMIVSLLEYSRVGRLTKPKDWLASAEPRDEALSFLTPAIEETAATVTTNGEWPRVFASRDELTRLFQNLIGNALHYRKQEEPPRISVDSLVVDGMWRVQVRDHGIGINPQQIGRLFQFFSRLQSRTRFDGTGMGLALCRRIVEHHGGRIWAESEGEGMGSTFIFEIPLTVEKPADAIRN